MVLVLVVEVVEVVMVPLYFIAVLCHLFKGWRPLRLNKRGRERESMSGRERQRERDREWDRERERGGPA